MEIDPRLVETSREHAKRIGVAHRAKFREQDLFGTDLSRASVIAMYLLPDVNMALRPKLLALECVVKRGFAVGGGCKQLKFFFAMAG